MVTSDLPAVTSPGHARERPEPPEPADPRGAPEPLAPAGPSGGQAVPRPAPAPAPREIPSLPIAAEVEAAARPSGRPLVSYLPAVVLATLIVAVGPIAVVWTLRRAGIITSPWIAPFLAIGLSSALSSAGCALWKRSKGSGDLLFSELLIWGWLGRWRSERQLVNAVELLGRSQTDGTRARDESWPAARQEQLLRQVAETLEAVDRYTRGHSDRVARHAENIARRMGLPAQQIMTIRAAALVHDIGKLRTPLEVLNKPGRLTDEEFAVIKRHPVDGAELVAGLHNDALTAIVRHHHERLDGKGYPDGLAGEEIPLGARIIAVADTFDAITSVRPYRPRREHKTALDILAAEAGRQLDRDAVRAFCTCYSGGRTVAVWTVITTALQRTLTWATGEASAATMTTGHLVAATVASVTIGAVATVPAATGASHTRILAPQGHLAALSMALFGAATPSGTLSARPPGSGADAGATPPARPAGQRSTLTRTSPRPGHHRRPASRRNAGRAVGMAPSPSRPERGRSAAHAGTAPGSPGAAAATGIPGSATTDPGASGRTSASARGKGHHSGGAGRRGAGNHSSGPAHAPAATRGIGTGVRQSAGGSRASGHSTGAGAGSRSPTGSSHTAAGSGSGGDTQPAAGAGPTAGDASGQASGSPGGGGSGAVPGHTAGAQVPTGGGAATGHAGSATTTAPATTTGSATTSVPAASSGSPPAG